MSFRVAIMHADGRARALRGLSHLIYLLVIKTISCSEYGVPIEIQVWDSGRTPLAHMVDVTNELGLKILASHNFLNENNIAFSPYGLTGIMVALYEGVEGESSYQIQRGMQMPWNRNILRIGFRDIHRTLKTYFIPEEGFLAGLALNNENVTFNENYKKILKFYGFDLDTDRRPTKMSPELNDTATVNNTVTPMTTDMPSTTTMATTTMAETTRREETTSNPNSETVTNIDIRIPTTTEVPSSAVNADIDTVIESTTMVPTTIPVTTISSEIMPPTAAEPEPKTTVAEMASTTSGDTEMSKIESTSATETTSRPTQMSQIHYYSTIPTTPETTSAEAENSTTTLSSETITINNTTHENTSTIATPLSKSTIVASPDSTAEATTFERTTDVTTETISPNEEDEDDSEGDEYETSTNDLNVATLETLQRRKKSIVDFIFTSPPYVDDYLIYRTYEIPSEEPITFIDSKKLFLANGLKNVKVTYMHYDTIMEHADLPHLEASALRLPLDSDRYYLLVVLPDREGYTDLGRLIARMARGSDLRDVYSALRPRRVRAIVPSFTVRGHVTLTTDLQKLGIQDVFEPRQRDFRPMTSQGNVYVRSIEQAVSVAIHKYRTDDQKRNRYVSNRVPVHFSATYPFIYFVMDASIHVALMAGKMVDPLNTRIL